jgi:hypothetical protein
MQELYLNMNSCTLILECTQGCGRFTGAFLEQTIAACSYRGELLGLMAIHLILLSMNRIDLTLKGLAHIYLDCLGALNKIEHLPPHRIPLKCQHSEVLKKRDAPLQLLVIQTLIFPHLCPSGQSYKMGEPISRGETQMRS